MAVQGQEASCPTPPVVITLFWIRFTWTVLFLFFTNTGALVLFSGILVQYIWDKDQPSGCFKR